MGKDFGDRRGPFRRGVRLHAGVIRLFPRRSRLPRDASAPGRLRVALTGCVLDGVPYRGMRHAADTVAGAGQRMNRMIEVLRKPG